jgi:hypothetical protein
METKAAILDALNVAGYINDERRAALEPKDIPAALAAIPVTIYGILTLLIQVVPLAGIGYLAWTGGAAGVALAVLLLLVFVLVRRFGILVRREGISVLRTWSGLALRPPVWVGAVPDSFVVFVRAPGLSTVSFSARRTTVVEAVWVARVLSAPEILAIVDQRTTVLHETARAYTRRAEHEDVRRAIAEHDQRVRRRLPSHPFDRSWWTRLRDFLFG